MGNYSGRRSLSKEVKIPALPHKTREGRGTRPGVELRSTDWEAVYTWRFDNRASFLYIQSVLKVTIWRN